jgi:hypothetical protein
VCEKKSTPQPLASCIAADSEPMTRPCSSASHFWLLITADRQNGREGGAQLTNTPPLN